jgi:hypothetical protein
MIWDFQPFIDSDILRPNNSRVGRKVYALQFKCKNHLKNDENLLDVVNVTHLEENIDRNMFIYDNKCY